MSKETGGQLSKSIEMVRALAVGQAVADAVSRTAQATFDAQVKRKNSSGTPGGEGTPAGPGGAPDGEAEKMAALFQASKAFPTSLHLG